MEESVEGFLNSLGLSDYYSIFTSEGFDSIQALEDITEDDFEHMKVKRGHRRILQRALCGKSLPVGPLECVASVPKRHDAGFSPQASVSPPSVPSERQIRYASLDRCGSWDRESCYSESSFTAGPSEPGAIHPKSITEPLAMFISAPKPKRRYRRHPKPDLNAPEKPLSAYVMFSKTVREQLKGQQISFTEIARLAGERWKTLEPSVKESFERKAAEEKDHWLRLMYNYKTTKEYEQHRQYLRRFKEAQACRNDPSEPYPRPLSGVNMNIIRSPKPPSRVTMGVHEDKNVEAGDCDERASHSALTSPSSSSAKSWKSRSRPPATNLLDASPLGSSGDALLPYHLPPPIPSKSQSRPTIPNLGTLDKHLTQSQTLFFKAKQPIRNDTRFCSDT